MNILVGLTGEAGSGKTSVASYLRSRGFAALSIADPIRGMVARLVGVSPDELRHDPRVKDSRFAGFSLRTLMQTLGTEWGRETLLEDFWLRILEQRIAAGEGGDPLVIDDVRFPNEAHWINNRGGCVIRLIRPDNPWRTNAMHPSEQWIPDSLIQYTVENDGELLTAQRNAYMAIRHFYRSRIEGDDPNA